MRTHRIIASFAALCLVELGCSFGPDLDGLEEGLGCATEGVFTAIGGVMLESRPGRSQRTELSGLCSILELCDETSPLMLGAEHSVWVTLQSDGTGGPSTDSFLHLVSSDPSVVESAGVEDIGCLTAAGPLQAKAEGETELAVATDGEVIDHHTVAVAAADSADLESLMDEDQPRQPVMQVGDAHWFRVTMRDAAGRVLVAGQAIEWQLADDGVLAYADRGEQPTGAIGYLEAVAAGDTSITVRVSGIEVSIPVQVAAAP